MNVSALPRAAVSAGTLISLCCAVLCGCSGGHTVASSTGSSASAANAALVQEGPQLGYLWSSSEQSLRPILGVPGASQLGSPVAEPGSYIAAAASARSGEAILEDKAGDLDLMSVPVGSPLPLSGVHVAGIAQFVFSPSGVNAVVFVPGQNTAFLVTGLSATASTQQPQVQALTSASAMTAAAVSDTGQVVSATGSNPTTLTLLTGNNAPVASLGGFGGIAFLPGGSDLLAVDSLHSVLTLIHGNGAAAQTFASSSFQSPFAVAASQDGNTAVVANGGDTSVVRVDLTNAANPMRIPCACQPDRLMPLAGNAVFAMTGPGNAPAWVVDASASMPRTLFIPAVVKQ